MSIYTAIAIYFVIWWISLFLVLPFGIRAQHEEGQVVRGSEPGAPIVPHVAWRLMWTTIVAAVIFAAGTAIYQLNGFNALARLLP